MDSRWFKQGFLVWLILIVVVVAIAVNLLHPGSSKSQQIGIGQLLNKARVALNWAADHAGTSCVPVKGKSPCLVTITQTAGDTVSLSVPTGSPLFNHNVISTSYTANYTGTGTVDTLFHDYGIDVQDPHLNYTINHPSSW